MKKNNSNSDSDLDSDSEVEINVNTISDSEENTNSDSEKEKEKETETEMKLKKEIETLKNKLNKETKTKEFYNSRGEKIRNVNVIRKLRENEKNQEEKKTLFKPTEIPETPHPKPQLNRKNERGIKLGDKKNLGIKVTRR